MKTYQNKYRISSTRLKNYDYGQNGMYFVTICTENRENLFGTISNQIMKLSSLGNIVQECWNYIPNHFPFVTLDVFVIMPNHVHGIIVINKKYDERSVETQDVETQNFASLQNQSQRIGNTFGPQSKNLASIIRGFKIGVTKWARNNTNIQTVWQSRFYDHVIQNDHVLEKIRNYILDNPKKWNQDWNNK